MSGCGHCGQQVSEGSRFCSACGAPVADTGRETRRTVTVVFCDLVDSTVLGERLDPELLREVLGRYFDVGRRALEAEGGTVEKFIGDAVVGVFGIPVLHDDDASRAVRAAVGIRDGVSVLHDSLRDELGIEIAVRLGVATGEVLAGTARAGGGAVTGDTMNLAARLQSAAAPGEIFLSERTRALVRGAVTLESLPNLALKGIAEPVRAARVLALQDPRARVTRTVGRTREHATVRAALQRGESVLVVGEPGIGKSQLLTAMADELATSDRVLLGRCIPPGEGTTFGPMVEPLRDALELAPPVGRAAAEVRLAALFSPGRLRDQAVAAGLTALGFTSEFGSVDETSWVLRRILDELGAERATLLVLEDLHWAESALLDLLEMVARSANGVALLGSARPDVFASRPAWSETPPAFLFRLEPLGEADGLDLVQHRLAGTAVPDGTLALIVATANGNPLFLQELCAFVLDAPDSAGELSVPPTVRAVIAARIDRLPTAEGTLLEHAAVIGESFDVTALAALDRGSDPAEPDALVLRELFEPDTGRPGAFRFSHALVRDAAYDAIPKRRRARLHERYAEWIEASTLDAARDEIIGFHLERAHRARAELGLDDGEQLSLATRASAALAAAGGRALATADWPGAQSLLRRGAALLALDAPDRLRMELRAGWSEWHALRDDDAGRGLIAVRDAAAAAGNEVVHATAVAILARVRIHTEPDADPAELERDVERAIVVLDAAGDEGGLAQAWSSRYELAFVQGRLAECDGAAERTYLYADAAGDRLVAAYAREARAYLAMFGSVPLDVVDRRFAEVLPELRSFPGLWTRSVIESALPAALRGDLRRARDALNEAYELDDEFGGVIDQGDRAEIPAWVAMLDGAPSEAEQILRAAYDPMMSHLYRSQLGAELAHALIAQGRATEALSFVVGVTVPEHDVQLTTLIASAEACARSLLGEHAVAVELIERAVGHAARSEYLIFHIDALVHQAEILLQAGHPDEAERAAREAAARADAKGYRVAVERAGHILGR